MNQQDREQVIRLKLIGSLVVGDKINTRYQQIQPDSFGTKLSRYLYGESRLNTIIFVRNTINHIQEMIPGIQDPNIKKIIVEDLQKAKLGLISLKETYAGDVRVTSQLEELIESIR
jgi:hypothetical protein